MAVSDIEAVLEFLRNNGFSESESALMEDILEKSHLGSSDLQNFLFPMVPPPPPLKISRRGLPEISSGGGAVAKDDDDDDLGYRLDDDSDEEEEEFVSLGSSTSELCSSEFSNPYGIRTATRPSSRSSSDNLSQFGTARDYHEFDMQNDLNWYKERDEDYVMPPHFGMSDYDECPNEDKFVTTLQKGEVSLSMANSKTEALQSTCTSDYYEKKWSMNSTESIIDGVFKDYYDMEQIAQHERFINMDPGLKPTDHNASINLEVAENEAFCSSTKNSFTYDTEDDFENQVVKEDNCLTEKGNDEYTNNVMAGESCEPDPLAEAEAEVAATSDEVVMYDASEDDYEVFNLKIIHRKNRTGFEEKEDFPVVVNSIIASRYYVTDYLGSAAFSKVIQAHDLYSGMDVCLKIIKNDKDFFDQSLDEIKLLKLANKYDPGDERHLLRLYDYFYHQEHLFIVCELLHANLYEFLKYNQDSGREDYFTMTRLQAIARQCLEALEYLHDLGIIHCDLKPENILIRSYRRCEIKVIDLGSSCFKTDNLSLYVQSRSYRAPEVILGLSYDQRIDLWSLGCVLAELYSGEVLFPNEAIALLLARMVAILGPIDMDMLECGQETHKYFTKEYELYLISEETKELEYVIPAEPSSLEQHLQISDSLFFDFLSKLLEINPQRRLTATEALEHPWFSHSYEHSASQAC